MVVTAAVFQSAIGPYVVVAVVGLVSHAVAAVLMFALVMAVCASTCAGRKSSSTRPTRRCDRHARAHLHRKRGRRAAPPCDTLRGGMCCIIVQRRTPSCNPQGHTENLPQTQDIVVQSMLGCIVSFNDSVEQSCNAAQLAAPLTSRQRRPACLGPWRRLRRSSSPQRRQSRTPRRLSANNIVPRLPSASHAVPYTLPLSRHNGMCRRLCAASLAACALCVRMGACHVVPRNALQPWVPRCAISHPARYPMACATCVRFRRKIGRVVVTHGHVRVWLGRHRERCKQEPLAAAVLPLSTHMGLLRGSAHMGLAYSVCSHGY
jgi:hypothetical protein